MTSIEYCKRLNFREDLIFASFASRLRFAKNRSREQYKQYVNTTEVTFDSRKLEPANNSKFPALARFAKIKSFTVSQVTSDATRSRKRGDVRLGNVGKSHCFVLSSSWVFGR
ncbi:MAG: hypothetical protein PV344_04145, partial [Anaplasma sp.]|nr:hypothetical protein [Anaplasma sp.]